MVELVRRLHGCSYREAAVVLAGLDRLDGSGGGHGHMRGHAQPPATPFAPYRTRLRLEPRHPFLTSRGLHPATATRHEVGAWHGRGMLAGCIGVRLHDPHGSPLGYAGRRLQPGDRGKWIFPPRLPKSRLLYGYHRVRHAQRLVLVEGAWDVLRLAQLGVPAVALLGTHLSPEQARLLRQHPSITVMLDGDAAGERAARTIASALDADVIALHGGHDPADLDDDELRRLLSF